MEAPYTRKIAEVVKAGNSGRFVLTDIHACIKTFERMLDKIALGITDQLFILGDYIDRGPDGKAVIDRLISLKKAGYQLHLLRGNHEAIFFEHINNYPYETLSHKLLEPGLVRLLDQYGRLTDPYDDFLLDLRYYIETDDAFMVHAAFDTAAHNPFEELHSMLWDRSMIYDNHFFKGKHVLHGHTPIALDEIKAAVDQKAAVINLDNGCVFSGKSGFGNLVCLELNDWQLHVVANKED